MATHDPYTASAALVMAYGGPESIDEVGPFMRELMGRDPSAEVVQRVQRRYLAIGGRSPLPGIAREFAGGLMSVLAGIGVEIPVGVGFRYTDPRLGSTLAQMHADGIRRVAAVSLSPFESKTTTVAYRTMIDDAVERLEGMEVIDVPIFSLMPEFVGVHAGQLAVALSELPDDVADDVLVVFTAHSLPCEDLQSPDDPYVNGVRRVSSAIAFQLGLPEGADIVDSHKLPRIASYGSFEGDRAWIFAYQSKGQRPCAWLGPELDDVIDAAAEGGYKAIVACPVGFATEHMETLWDLDVAAAERALAKGLFFARSMAPNSHPLLLSAVASAVKSSLD